MKIVSLSLAAPVAIAIAAVALPVQAAISVTSTAFAYAQNFDSLTTSTVAVSWTQDSTLLGWSLFTSTLADITTYAADNGGSNTGTFRSFGSSGSSDRALGGLASGGAYFGSPSSGAIAGYIAISFTNNSGSALAGFTLGFDGEQWRNGGNTNAQSLVAEYGLGASFGAVTWTAPGSAFNVTSVANTATAAAIDGNVAGKIAGLGGSINTPWAVGQTLWVRWIDTNDVGNDHGLSIDNLSFSVTPVPEPGQWALLLAGLAAVGFVARRRA